MWGTAVSMRSNILWEGHFHLAHGASSFFGHEESPGGTCLVAPGHTAGGCPQGADSSAGRVIKPRTLVGAPVLTVEYNNS